MRTIIAGSRTITNPDLVELAVILSGFRITEVVSGGARGADALGEQWASANKVKVRRFPADWEGEGKQAGANRNKRMAEYASALVAVWDGRSSGTRHMIWAARRVGLKVFVYEEGRDW